MFYLEIYSRKLEAKLFYMYPSNISLRTKLDDRKRKQNESFTCWTSPRNTCSLVSLRKDRQAFKLKALREAFTSSFNLVLPFQWQRAVGPPEADENQWVNNEINRMNTNSIIASLNCDPSHQIRLTQKQENFCPNKLDSYITTRKSYSLSFRVTFGVGNNRQSCWARTEN